MQATQKLAGKKKVDIKARLEEEAEAAAEAEKAEGLFVYFFVCLLFICHVISCLLTFLFVFCLHLVVEEEKDDGVMRIYFDPPHYTVMESVGSFMTTIVRKGGDHRFVYFFFCLPIFFYVSCLLTFCFVLFT